MKGRVITKADSMLRKRCEELSPRERKWIVIILLSISIAAFIYNLIIEFL